jgi:hypothetical protein
VDEEEGPSRGPKKKKMAKKQSPPENDKEKGYTQRKSPALSVWYLLIIDRLHALFRNPEDAKLMSWHASAERNKKDGGKL